MNTFEYHMMHRALALAERGLHTTWPNPRVGCVVTHRESVIGEGYHKKTGGPHAEVLAIQDCHSPLHEATLFVTLEPCCHHGKTGPCTELIVEKGIKKVYVAVRDPNPQVAGKGIDYLRAHGVEVIEGICEKEARLLNIGFFSRYERQRPWVRLKQALSLDGKTALSSGKSQWITGPQSRMDVQEWRARADVIATGIGSVCLDNPRLNVRYVHVQNQPLCAVFDSEGKIPSNSRLFDVLRPVIIFCASMPQDKREQLMDQGVEVIDVPNTDHHVNLHAALAYLAKRGHSELHLETGRRLGGSFLSSGLIDESIFYIAPKLLGESAAGLLSIPEPITLDGAEHLHLNNCTTLGEDIRLHCFTQTGLSYLNKSYVRLE